VWTIGISCAAEQVLQRWCIFIDTSHQTVQQPMALEHFTFETLPMKFIIGAMQQTSGTYAHCELVPCLRIVVNMNAPLNSQYISYAVATLLDEN
jgi:hypothetical protein